MAGTSSDYGTDLPGAPLRQEYRPKFPRAHQPFRKGAEYGYVREWPFFAFLWPLAAKPPNTALGLLIARKGHSLSREWARRVDGLHRGGGIQTCFNGASVFQPRKGGTSTSRAAMTIRFNGASVFQPRKDADSHDVATRPRDASMGPRSFNRGRSIGSLLVVLQWACFNGASVFQPRKAAG